jgi:hypothetical protein
LRPSVQSILKTEEREVREENATIGVEPVCASSSAPSPPNPSSAASFDDAVEGEHADTHRAQPYLSFAIHNQIRETRPHWLGYNRE